MKKSILILGYTLGILLLGINIFIYKLYSLQKENCERSQKFIEEFCESLKKWEENETRLGESYLNLLEDLKVEAFKRSNYRVR